MPDPPDSESHRTDRGPDPDRPGPDWDPAGVESRTDEDAGIVTFLSRQGDRETSTAWLTVDAENVLDVEDCR